MPFDHQECHAFQPSGITRTPVPGNAVHALERCNDAGIGIGRPVSGNRPGLLVRPRTSCCKGQLQPTQHKQDTAYRSHGTKPAPP